MSNLPVQQHIGTTAVTTVGTATAFEQIMAGVLGLVTAGPLGAAASWGCIKGFQGKWGPWGMTGLVGAPLCIMIQVGVLSAANAAPVEIMNEQEKIEFNTPDYSEAAANAEIPTFTY